MHGAGSGAPRGNRNALKHERYTAEAIAERRWLRELIRNVRN
jgi:glucans biosynthesis protein